jgi:hypothetical protein
MSDSSTPQDSAAMSPASAGYGYAWKLVQNIAIAASLAAVLIFVAKSINAKPKPPQGFVTVCSGCGSEFESYGPGKPDPITKCPNCPMTPEEWERLKDELRRGR